MLVDQGSSCYKIPTAQEVLCFKHGSLNGCFNNMLQYFVLIVSSSGVSNYNVIVSRGECYSTLICSSLTSRQQWKGSWLGLLGGQV